MLASSPLQHSLEAKWEKWNPGNYTSLSCLADKLYGGVGGIKEQGQGETTTLEPGKTIASLKKKSLWNKQNKCKGRDHENLFYRATSKDSGHRGGCKSRHSRTLGPFDWRHSLNGTDVEHVNKAGKNKRRESRLWGWELWTSGLPTTLLLPKQAPMSWCSGSFTMLLPAQPAPSQHSSNPKLLRWGGAVVRSLPIFHKVRNVIICSCYCFYR